MYTRVSHNFCNILTQFSPSECICPRFGEDDVQHWIVRCWARLILSECYSLICRGRVVDELQWTVKCWACLILSECYSLICRGRVVDEPHWNVRCWACLPDSYPPNLLLWAPVRPQVPRFLANFSLLTCRGTCNLGDISWSTTSSLFVQQIFSGFGFVMVQLKFV